MDGNLALDDPPFAAMITLDDWKEYVEAFA
jgi:hypothetical protein